MLYDPLNEVGQIVERGSLSRDTLPALCSISPWRDRVRKNEKKREEERERERERIKNFFTEDELGKRELGIRESRGDKSGDF